MSYRLEGNMIELCTCDVICPCWVGEDPDGGDCKGVMAWHIDSGEVDGVDVSGLTLALAAYIPGNALDGGWRATVFVDDRASEEQEKALLDVYTGQRGGPVADLAQLVGEVVEVGRAPITFDADQGSGSLRVGDAVEATMEGLVGATGEPTTLGDTVFSSIPGAPGYPGKTTRYRLSSAALDIDLDIDGQSAVQAPFRFEA